MRVKIARLPPGVPARSRTSRPGLVSLPPHRGRAERPHASSRSAGPRHPGARLALAVDVRRLLLAHLLPAVRARARGRRSPDRPAANPPSGGVDRGTSLQHGARQLTEHDLAHAVLERPAPLECKPDIRLRRAFHPLSHLPRDHFHPDLGSTRRAEWVSTARRSGRAPAHNHRLATARQHRIGPPVVAIRTAERCSSAHSRHTSSATTCRSPYAWHGRHSAAAACTLGPRRGRAGSCTRSPRLRACRRLLFCHGQAPIPTQNGNPSGGDPYLLPFALACSSVFISSSDAPLSRSLRTIRARWLRTVAGDNDSRRATWAVE